MGELRDRIYTNYQAVHESHLGVGPTERAAWMADVYRLNIRPYLSPGTVLEIGCGLGGLLDAVHEDRRAVTGTDLCQANVDFCRIRSHEVYREDWLLGAKTTLRFDNIILMGLIEHFTKDELLTVAESLYAMLRPGGHVIMTTMNMDSLVGVHFRYLDLTHEVGFTRESLNELGRVTGFKVACHSWRHTPPTRLRGRLVETLIRPWYRWLYRLHIRLLGGWLGSTWYDVDGLVGVWERP